MMRLLHMSDLHFGRDRPELHETLLEVINALRPDLVVISGDLTQRARDEQFAAARWFIDQIRAPVLAVPGNHDVPLYNLAWRIAAPFYRYRHYIAQDLEPVFQTEGLVVAGLNTVDPYAWQRGRARRASVRRVCSVFRAAPRNALRVLAAHHPFEQEAGSRKAPMAGAQAALAALTEAGTDIVLTGHLHRWAVAPHQTGHNGSVALQVQAGTGLSDRLRGEENDFNLIEVGGTDAVLTRHIADDRRVYTPGAKLQLHMTPRGWVPVPADD